MTSFIHSLLFASIVYASSTVSTTTNDYAKQEVYRVFADTPVMIEVADCESGIVQFDASGTPLRGTPNPDDIGIFQINKKFHGKEAEDMCIDIYTVDGNIDFAQWLYVKQGLAPWKYSEKCWN